MFFPNKFSLKIDLFSSLVWLLFLRIKLLLKLMDKQCMAIKRNLLVVILWLMHQQHGIFNYQLFDLIFRFIFF